MRSNKELLNISKVDFSGRQPEEQPVEIKRFSQEAREALEKQGYIIYGLTGASIKSQREAGRPFRTPLLADHTGFTALQSMQSEVSINPDKLFLPESNNRTLAKQEEMVDKFSQELNEKVPGVKAIIGQAPDYVELSFQHFDATKDRLFGEKYGYNYTRTKTPTDDTYVAGVGGFEVLNGLNIGRWAPDGFISRGISLYVVPLVVPV